MICNKENDRKKDKKRGEIMSWGGEDRLGRMEWWRAWGWGRRPVRLKSLPHSAVRCGPVPHHPGHPVHTSMKWGHQRPPPHVVGITPSARTHSLTQEEAMQSCRENEPCSATYTVRVGSSDEGGSVWMTSVEDIFEGWDFIFFLPGASPVVELIAYLPLLNAAGVSGMQMEC